MIPRKRTFKVHPHERQILLTLYKDTRIPIDQFEGRPTESSDFVGRWNDLTGRKDTIGQLVCYMRTQRKQSKWIKLGKLARPVPSLPFVSAEHQDLLIEIYKQLFAGNCLGCDEIFYNEEFITSLVNAFVKQTGVFQPGWVLVSYLTKLRKRGYLPQVEQEVSQADLGFDDLEQAAGG